VTPLGLVLGGAALVLAGSLLSAPAQSQDDPSAQPPGRIGYVDVRQLRTRATVWEKGLVEVRERERDVAHGQDIEKTWVYLCSPQAARGIELELMGAARSQEETEELDALRAEHAGLELEFHSLKNSEFPTSEELQRLRELLRICEKRQEEIRQASEEAKTELAEHRRKVKNGWIDSLVSSLKPTAEKHDLDIVLSSHVPTWQPGANGTGPGLVWENVVLFGGVDVTDDVIATMNSDGPPPAPSGGGLGDTGAP